MDYAGWGAADSHTEKLNKKLKKLQKKSRKDKKRIKQLEYGYGQLQYECRRMEQTIELMAYMIYQAQQSPFQLQTPKAKQQYTWWQDALINTAPQIANVAAALCGKRLSDRSYPALPSGK